MNAQDKQSLVSENDHSDSLNETLTQSFNQNQNSNSTKKNRKWTSNKIMLIFLALIGVGLIIFGGVLLFQSANEHENGQIYPIRIQLAIYDNVTIVKGNSRVVEVLFYSGYDDRGTSPFKIVNQRELVWHVEPEGIIQVDRYGRIKALSEGTATLKVSSLSNFEIFDQKIIQVVSSNFSQSFNQLPRRIVNYTGTPAKNYANLQKIVTRVAKENVQSHPEIPESIKKVSSNPQTSEKVKFVSQNNGQIVWSITSYADRSSNTYVKRVYYSLEDGGRDKIMYFIGNRYLPEDGKYALSIEDDKNLGIWVVGKNGDVTHIEKIDLTYEQKAQMMVKNTQKYVLRQGIASQANFDTKKQKWITGITDNDGLWTSLYAAGELMRYDHLRSINASFQKIKLAKQSAFPSLKAVLITDWISGRSGEVDAKIRSFNNSRASRAYRLSSYYLKKDRTFAVQNYVGSPCDKTGYYGLDANKTVAGSYFGGEFKYSLHPFNMDDWTETEEPATTKRSLGGFMARTFAIPELDGSDRFGGLFFQRFPNGSHLVINSARELYDYTNNDHPMLQLGNESLPQALKSNLLVNGKQYDVFDMVYKGQTSTDEVIGHLFLYKIAFDIMDESDSEEKELKNLIRQTMINFSQHLLNNGYQMVDATGQGTSWSKLVRDFLNNDYTTEDAPLKALQLLLCFKLTHYMTGDIKYQKEYEFLINDPAFRYGELVGKFWQRWVYINENEDYDPSINLYRFNFTKNTTQEELLRHHIYTFHYSDDEEAMLAFYLIFQLQLNETLLEFYRKGMEAYWNHIKLTENPLWYYIYQLAYPKEEIRGINGDSMLEVASWQLTRHPIETTRFQAYVQGSRPDVIYEGDISVNPFKVIGQRTNEADIIYASNAETYKIYPEFDPKNIYEIHTLPADERSIHKFNNVNFQNIQSNNPNSMQPSTTYTLPYWFGVYHKMLKYET